MNLGMDHVMRISNTDKRYVHGTSACFKKLTQFFGCVQNIPGNY